MNISTLIVNSLMMTMNVIFQKFKRLIAFVIVILIKCVIFNKTYLIQKMKFS